MKHFTAHYKDLARLGLPIVIGQLGIIFVSFVDTFMVSRHGTNDLAAASFVNNMFNLAIIFATGFSYGLTPIVGKFFGKGKKVSDCGPAQCEQLELVILELEDLVKSQSK
jgi:MATE family multidrug resistance protein